MSLRHHEVFLCVGDKRCQVRGNQGPGTGVGSHQRAYIAHSVYFPWPVIKKNAEAVRTRQLLYEVTLTDRTEIDFDKKGNWTEVDCKKNAVPAALIPASVKDYVKANFPNEIITKIERKSTGIEVELANDFSLKFNKKGQFVSLDD